MEAGEKHSLNRRSFISLAASHRFLRALSSGTMQIAVRQLVRAQTGRENEGKSLAFSPRHHREKGKRMIAFNLRGDRLKSSRDSTVILFTFTGGLCGCVRKGDEQIGCSVAIDNVSMNISVYLSKFIIFLRKFILLLYFEFMVGVPINYHC